MRHLVLFPSLPLSAAPHHSQWFDFPALRFRLHGFRPLDLTGDGRPDARGFDTTGDGRIDALDTTGDGPPCLML